MEEGAKSSRESRRLVRVIEVQTAHPTQMKNITAEVEKAVAASDCRSGICCVYVPHTTAGVMINEGDDPDVMRDIEATFSKLVPHAGAYRHAEGNADAHIKTALTGNSLTLFIENGRLALGRWQAIFFCEFDGPRRREARVKVIPDAT